MLPIHIMRIRTGTGGGGGGGGGGPFATWDTVGGAVSLSNGNRTATYAAAPGPMARSNSPFVNKTYAEISFAPSGDAVGVGLCNSTQNLAVGYLGQSVNGAGYYLPSADVYRNAVAIYNGSTYSSTPVVVGVAFDNLNVWIRRPDGLLWEGGGDPTTGTSPTFTMAAGTYYPACTPGNGSSACTINAGQSAFVLWTPSGGFAGVPL